MTSKVIYQNDPIKLFLSPLEEPKDKRDMGTILTVIVKDKYLVFLHLLTENWRNIFP